jgi:hypothetical protein
MKKILLAITMGLCAFSVQAADAPKEAPKTKQICKDTVGKDGKPVKNKDGSVKQTCRTIKIHKKYEGTSVPTPPKK